jgi:2-haloacid dehalogenase
VAARWATFDCYGTLVDWNAGLRLELERLFGAAADDRLLARFHEIEAEVEAEQPAAAYREVLSACLRRLAEGEAVELAASDDDALARSLPGWPVVPEVPGALRRARTSGWRLCVLSNSDRDLLVASLARIGVPFEASIVASEIGSYKPALGHWRVFERTFGRLPDVHVAASLFHDIGPANELGLPSVWINRLGEKPGPRPARELTTLEGLAETLEELVPG